MGKGVFFLGIEELQPMKQPRWLVSFLQANSEGSRKIDLATAPVHRLFRSAMAPFYTCTLIILSIFPLLASSTLDFTPGSLSGTSLDLPHGLSDKQLAIFSWLEGLVYEAEETNDWPDIYKTNQTGNFPTQRGMPSYRYSLAFTGYAAAAKALTHTPSYTKPTFDVLSSIFKLMVREEVYSYWVQKGDCAPFFLTTYCENHNTSMCDLNEQWHGKNAINCPDPVYFGNIMYSAHLAHIGALVRLFAPTPEAAEEVLKFTLGNTEYTLDSLLQRLVFQAEDQKGQLGGGITCEPANVYPSCQVRRSEERSDEFRHVHH